MTMKEDSFIVMLVEFAGEVKTSLLWNHLFKYSWRSRKQPPWEFRKVVTIRAGHGHLQELLAGSLAYVDGQWTISAYVMHYSKFDQEVS